MVNTAGLQEREINRAGIGAAMIAAALFMALALLESGEGARAALALIGGDVPLPPTTMVVIAAGWALFFGVGVLLLLAGAARSYGPRDSIVAAKALAWTAVASAAMFYGAYIPGWPITDFLLKAVYVALLAASMMRLLLALRGMPAQALPDPSELDLPVSGPASQDEAMAGMSGKDGWHPPHFDN